MSSSSCFAYGEKPVSSSLVVVADQDPDILSYFNRILGRRTHLSLLSDPAQASRMLSNVSGPDLALIDSYFGDDPSGTSAFGLVADIRRRWPFTPVVVMSCTGNVHELMHANRLGSSGLILKPFHESDIEGIFRQYVEARHEEQLDTAEIPLDENSSFVRASRRMREIEAHCRLVASTDIPVLVLGESGT